MLNPNLLNVGLPKPKNFGSKNNQRRSYSNCLKFHEFSYILMKFCVHPKSGLSPKYFLNKNTFMTYTLDFWSQSNSDANLIRLCVTSHCLRSRNVTCLRSCGATSRACATAKCKQDYRK